MSDVPTLIAGRSCGSCNLCCKVFPVPAIDNKPQNVWCKHCKPGQGCGIWEARPEVCQDFHCQYFFDKSMTDEWRPDRAKFLLTQEAGGIWLSIVTDQQNAKAWMRAPYGPKLRALAAQRMEQNLGLLWITPTQKYVVTPDKEVLVGSRDADVKVRFDKTVVAGRNQFAVTQMA